MHLLRRLVPLALALALATFLPGRALAQDIPEDEDPRMAAWAGAGLSVGVLAFDAYLLTRDDDAFGPRPFVAASLSLALLGAVGTHAASFALLDPRLARDPRARGLLGGLALLSSGLTLVAFALPTAWSLTSDPPDGEEAVALVSPYLLGAMGLAGIAAGIAIMATARSSPDPGPRLSLGVSPTSASITISGRF